MAETSVRIFIYFIDLPPHVHEMIVPCIEGFTVYLDIKDDDAHRQKSLIHALQHIERNDFNQNSVERIEADSRKGA